MKITSIMCLVAGIMCATGSTFAQESAPKKPKAPVPFAKLDKNADGKIAKAEFVTGEGKQLEAKAKMFAKKDADKDGFLTAAEYAKGNGKAEGKGKGKGKGKNKGNNDEE